VTAAAIVICLILINIQELKHKFQIMRCVVVVILCWWPSSNHKFAND